MKISELMGKLIIFRAEATPETFKQLFGVAGAGRLWLKYHGFYKEDLVRFYISLNEREQALFEAHLVNLAE